MEVIFLGICCCLFSFCFSAQSPEMVQSNNQNLHSISSRATRIMAYWWTFCSPFGTEDRVGKSSGFLKAGVRVPAGVLHC